MFDLRSEYLGGMDVVAKLKREISRKLSAGSLGKSGRFSFRRQGSLDLRPGNASRFAFGRQSSLDPNRRSPLKELAVPENLDSTMQLLFMASRGDAKGIENLLKEGVDVNSIDLDGRTALHIVACEGHVDVVRLLLSWKANIDARDRWGSTVNFVSFLLLLRRNRFVLFCFCFVFVFFLRF